MITVDIARGRELRLAAGTMIGSAAVWPLLPLHPSLACPLRTTTGIPCPMCGMTRAVVAAAHGDVGASLRYNPVGIVVLALAVALVLAPSLARARWRVRPWAAVAAVGMLWAYNIALNPTFN
ncbi:MAG: DUF2752 domain-containing protein [Actinomycetota bacterium]